MAEIISTLGAGGIKYFAPRVLGKVIGEPQYRRLSEIGDQAVNQTLVRLELDVNDPLDDILKEVLRNGGIIPILDYCSQGGDVDLEVVERIFVEQGGDLSTLPLEFITIIDELALTFANTLDREALRAESPLQGFYLVSRIGNSLRRASLNSLEKATVDVSRSISEELLPDYAIRRDEIINDLFEFLNSDSRWGALIGASGTGKTIALCHGALEAIEDDWIVLLQRGWSFCLQDAAEAVARYLPDPLAIVDWYRLLFSPWKNGAAISRGKRFLLVIDGIDEGDRDQFRKAAQDISDSLRGVPGDSWKIIVSSGEIRWPSLSQYIPFSSGSRDRESIFEISIGDFDDLELDKILVGIRAEDFLQTALPSGRPDPFIEDVRALIKHPATFDLIARMLDDEGLGPNDLVTREALTSQFIQNRLNAVERQCGHNEDFLRDSLLKIVSLGRRGGFPDGRIQLHTLQAELPYLRIELADPAQSPYVSLIEKGILEERDIDTRKAVFFRQQEVACWLLAIVLRQEAEPHGGENLESLIAEWLEEASSYPLIVDGLIVWIEILATNPLDPKLLTIIKTILFGHSLRLDVVFRLIPPPIALSILEIAKASDQGYWGSFYKAVESLRVNSQILDVYRSLLNDSDQNIQELAIYAVGVNRDEGSVEALSRLLSDDDTVGPRSQLLEDQANVIKGRVTRALGRIGEPAIPAILLAVEDNRKALTTRARHLHSLRAIGFRSVDVERALTSVLREAIDLGAPDLVGSALLASASLRCEVSGQMAIELLESIEGKVVWDTAKLLTEVPVAGAESALISALDKWSHQPKTGWIAPAWICSQICAALQMLGTDRSDAATISLLQDGCLGRNSLSLGEIARIAAKLANPAAKVTILESLLNGLRNRPIPNEVSTCLEVIGESRIPSQMASLKETTRVRFENGESLAELVVDALLDCIHSDVDHPLSHFTFQNQAIDALLVCNTPKLAKELARLLPDAQPELRARIHAVMSDLGDTQVEEALLDQLRSEVEHEDNARSAETLLHALTTCGTKVSTGPIVEFLKAASFRTIPPGFSESILTPLVNRGILSIDDLQNIVSDPNVSEGSRIVSIQVLADLEPERSRGIFERLLIDETNTRIRGFSVWGMRRAIDDPGISALMKCLDDSDCWVASMAALALSEMGAEKAVSRIEQIVARSDFDFPIDNFIYALEMLHHSSSLPILLGLLEKNPYSQYRSNLIEAIEIYWPEERAREAIFGELLKGLDEADDRREQIAPITALARYEPNVLLELVLRWHPGGYLHRSSRQQVASWISGLSDRLEVDPDLLVSVAICLACDRDLRTRDLVGQSMSQISLELAERIFSGIQASKDEWSQACAIRTLGYWHPVATEIEIARISRYRLIREAGDFSRDTSKKYSNIKALFSMLESDDSGNRAAAKLALQAIGDDTTLWRLKRYDESSPISYLAASIWSYIVRRQRKEYTDYGRREDDQMTDNRGIIYYD